MTRSLVYGLAVAGEATAAALAARGSDLVLVDDSDTPEVHETAARLGLGVEISPEPERIGEILRSVDLVAPSPGLPESHVVFKAAAAAGVPVRSEIDLAYEWEQQRPGGPRPMLAVTGTDGKTTTTAMAEAMLVAAGHRVAAAGNTDLPLVGALDLDVDVFVVECSSFRLATTTCFRAEASAWLNLAPDHLNWHANRTTYAAAKARMWRFVRPGDVAIGFLPDAAVMAHLRQTPCRQVTFGAESADYHQVDGLLVGPSGSIGAAAAMKRSLPHDRTNALAAAALVMEAGLADATAVMEALADFRGPPHRIELVADCGGRAWYDDSKATTPHAALAAISSFDSVVLIAGGRNKDLDLSELRAGTKHLRAVVAMGECAAKVVTAFEGIRPVYLASDMADAVRLADSLAEPGDVVLLSPACASFDAFDNYGHRGDVYAELVREHLSREDRVREHRGHEDRKGDR